MSFEIENLDPLERRMLNILRQDYPKETKKLVRSMTRDVLRLARSNTKIMIGTKTGYYKKHWKPGKLYKRGNNYYMRANNVSQHAHLIESGHKVTKKKGGPKLGEARAFGILEKSVKQFEPKIEKMVVDYMDKMFRELKL